jgi:hypothetical protein
VSQVIAPARGLGQGPEGYFGLGFALSSSSPVAPVAPVLTASPGNAVVGLTWAQPAGVTGIKVYWKTSPGVTTGDAVITLSISPAAYSHTGRTNGQAYYYRPAGTNALGESALGDEVAATPQAPLGPSTTRKENWVS